MNIEQRRMSKGVNAAPVVNQTLAELLSGAPNPFEGVSEDQTATMPWKAGMNTDAMRRQGRLVMLACRHFIITKALHRAKCRR